MSTNSNNVSDSAHNSREFQATLLENISDAVFSTDSAYIITSWNKAAEELYGWREDEALGKNGFELIPPTLVKWTMEDVLHILQEAGKWKGEVIQQHKNGSSLYIFASTSALKNLAGEVVGYVTINRDITERRRVREERERLLASEQEARREAEALSKQLVKEQEILRLAQKAGHIGAFEWFIQENRLVWTPELAALYGLPPGSFEGKYENWIEWVHPEDFQRTESSLRRATTEGTPYDVEFRVIWTDGSVHWLLAQGDVYRDANSQPDRIVGVNIDITERKVLEQRKDEFVGMASHELKTPITSLKGFLYLLRRDLDKQHSLPEQTGTYIEKMERQINRLTMLVNDLLDISRMQTGKLRYREELFDLDTLIQEIAENVQAMAPSHSLIYEAPTTAQVYGDRDRIGQALTNLLTNAVKYSPQADEVHIRIIKDEERQQVRVSVQDVGIGIGKAHQEKIFERFYQVSEPGELPFSGLGIGLFLSSEIIKHHGGSIQVDSERGSGSTFSFTLPLVRPERAGSDRAQM